MPTAPHAWTYFGAKTGVPAFAGTTQNSSQLTELERCGSLRSRAHFGVYFQPGTFVKTFGGYPIKSGFFGPDWELENCAAAALEHPATFEVPASDEAALVQVGDLLKLHFLVTDPTIVAESDAPRAERMWVEVCDLPGQDLFRGHLTNMPAFIRSLEPGDVIEFQWEHVAQVYVRAGDPRHARSRT